MTKVIKVTTEEEYQTCLEIRRLVFIVEQKVEKDLEIDEFEKESIHFLAYYRDQAVGTGRLRLHKSLLKFERVATLVSMRGLGIGKAIMLKMQAYGEEHYPEYLQAMHAQESALTFYEKLGWTAVGEPFDDANIPHKVMIRSPKDPSHLKCLKDQTTPKPILDFFNQ